jgi:hypothetical protein
MEQLLSPVPPGFVRRFCPVQRLIGSFKHQIAVFPGWNAASPMEMVIVTRSPLK